MNIQMCDYCNAREGRFYFQNGRWCCEDNVNKCPEKRYKMKQKLLDKYRNSKRGILMEQLNSGSGVCKYCGEPAKYISPGNHGLCCSVSAFKCPSYREYAGDIHRRRFNDDPSKREIMSKAMLEVHNREEVIEKKRTAMTILHNDECDKCKDFQKNYQEGRKKMRTTMINKTIEELQQFGVKIEEMPDNQKARTELVRKLRKEEKKRLDEEERIMAYYSERDAYYGLNQFDED